MSSKSQNNMQEPIYVIAGKESALTAKKCAELVNQLLSEEEKATSLLAADSDKADIADILDELRTLPFLARKRVVLIRDADKFVSANRGILEGYFENPCPTGVLILTVSTWAKNTKLAKKLSKNGFINVTAPGRAQLPGNLAQYAKEMYNKDLPLPVARDIVELAGENLGKLYGEVDKLALFAADEKKITIDHVEALIGKNRLFNAFNVIDSVLAGDKAGAVEKLRNMFQADKAAEFTVVGAFAYHFRKMFNAKALLEKGMSSFDVSQKLNIWGNKDGFFAQLRKMTLNQIGRGIERLAEIDYQIKTGQTSPKVAIEQMVLKMAA